jgi:hypothetical protein
VRHADAAQITLRCILIYQSMLSAGCTLQVVLRSDAYMNDYAVHVDGERAVDVRKVC